MKKLLLVAVVIGGLMFAGTTRSDAQVYFSIGFGPGLRILSLRLLFSVPVLCQTLLSPVLLVRRTSLLPTSLSLLLPALV